MISTINTECGRAVVGATHDCTDGLRAACLCMCIYLGPKLHSQTIIVQVKLMLSHIVSSCVLGLGFEVGARYSCYVGNSVLCVQTVC